ncbi:putative protein OS=Streptomyces microflavus OX=1919 GN=Smic_25710 PE=4 SV=1 [Streptomyces microflavus]
MSENTKPAADDNNETEGAEVEGALRTGPPGDVRRQASSPRAACVSVLSVVLEN